MFKKLHAHINVSFLALLFITLNFLALAINTFLNNAYATTFNTPTTLIKTPQFSVQRQGTFFVIELLQPHQVLSTSAFNGGQSNNIRYLVNHQSMEAKGDDKHFFAQLSKTREQYHSLIAQKLNIPSTAMALMGTAANIQQMAMVEKSFENLTVSVFVTAGVKGNAQRAGDETRWYQKNVNNKIVNKSVKKQLKKNTSPVDNSGTINIIVHINQAVTAGAQSKIAILATEAKSAALAQLNIASKTSSYLATGTGTDQLIIASPTNTQQPPLPSASGHLKLGELVGKAVHEGVLKALRWQNKLEASNTSNIIHTLQRFGLTQTRLLNGLQQHLSTDDFLLAKKNINTLTNDTRLNASVFAYAKLLDQLQYKTLPMSIAPEALRDQAAQIAIALSAKPENWLKNWQALTLNTDNNAITHQNKVAFTYNSIELAIHAIALGWAQKWAE